MRAYLQAVILVLLAFSPVFAAPRADTTRLITQLPSEGLLLDQGWKYQAGNNARWADPHYDDRAWQAIDPTKDIHDLPLLWTNQVGWFRLRFNLDSTLRQESLALLVEQTGASEIYLNGRLIGKYGRVGSSTTGVQAASPPHGEFISFLPGGSREQVLAVRFALQQDIPYVNFADRHNYAQAFRLMTMQAVTEVSRQNIYFLDYIKASVFFILALLHLVLLLRAPHRKANQYFLVFALLSAVNFSISGSIFQYMHLTATRMYSLILIFVLCTGSYFFFMLAAYDIFKQGRGLFFRCLSGVFFLSLPLFLLFYKAGWLWGLVLFPVLVFLDSVRLGLLRSQVADPGIRIVQYGAVAFLVLYLLALSFFSSTWSGQLLGHLTFTLAVVSLPVSLSIYLAVEASSTSRALEARLGEVEQLSQKTQRQEQEKRQLEEMDAIKSHFFANISHEFRTPLALIQGTAERMSTQESSPQKQAEYGFILRSAGKLLQMVNQLLDLSRLESGKLALQPRPVNVSELLKVLGGSFAALFENKEITYRYTVPLQPLWVQLDSQKLEQIVSNLLSNAAKFTPSGGQVQFTATVQEASAGNFALHISVQDTGVGIGPAHLPRIFDRFYQADPSATRSYEGTGIGLALVKELVDLHGGQVRAESTVGTGTTVWVQLPLVLSPAAEAAAGELLAPKEALHQQTSLAEPRNYNTTTPAGRGEKHVKHILLVEDNPDLRRFMAGYLSESYRVSESENGLDAFEQAVETVPDLIISDVMMPGLDGLSLCRKLKQDERTSHVPLVLLTAKADPESRINGLERGADDYLTKPFSTEELRIRVENLIRQRQRLREKFSRSLTLQPADIAVTSADERFLQKVLAVTEENIANADFDVEAFCKAVGLSQAQLNRKLSALLDQSPSQFIRCYRLKRAALLLQNGAGTVSEVAYQVGFTNLPHFSKAFRDHHGVTPSQYLTGSNAPGNG
jgi:signal transduction histidine kinase/DNA-binding response OmpR family regulator